MGILERIKRERSVGKVSKAIAAACIFVAAAMAFMNAQSAIISVRDIGDLGGGGTIIEDLALAWPWSSPFQTVINDLGQVVGISYVDATTVDLFVWDERSLMTDLREEYSRVGINNAGQVYYQKKWEGAVQVAIWHDGVTKIVGAPGSPETRVYDMSDVGTVVGEFYNLGLWLGYMLPNGASDIIPLRPLLSDTDSWANSVNDFNKAVGGADGTYHNRACMWGVDGVPHDLGDLPDTSAADYKYDAYEINNQEQVMGYWWYYGESATRWEGTFFWSKDPDTGSVTMQDIGCPEGASYVVGMDMNDNGVIAGNAWIDMDTASACVWDKTNGLTQLPYLVESGRPLSLAVSINDANQIVGSCPASDGYEHACLWEWDESSGDWVVLDLGTMGGITSRAVGINNKGEVACQYHTSSTPSLPRAFLWKSQTAQEASGELAEDISNRVGDENIATSMTVKVGAAQHQMDKNNDKAAVAILEALMKQVEAQVRAGKISETDGAYLMEETKIIINELMAPTQ